MRTMTKGLSSTVQVYTDYQGLQYFNTKRRLNSRQATWYLELSEFNFLISYHPGKSMGKPDALTRCTGDEKLGLEERMFKQNQLLALDGINAEDILDVHIEGINCLSWERSPNALLIVPQQYRPEILRQCHDSKVAGRQRMQELVSLDFVWEGWREEVTQYVALCQKCQRSKFDHYVCQTKLVPMPTGSRPWEEIAIDFIGELPESEGFNAILVITDRFTKMQRYIPALTTWMASDVANAYICHIWKHYGLPKHIT